FCMGASVGNAVGFSIAQGDNGGPRAVGVIGDGTFLHGGIPGLIDMVYKGSRSTLVICDNMTTGMTGQQANPSSGHTIHGEAAPRVDLVKLIESIGVRHVRVVDPYDLKALRKTLSEAIRHPGPAVVVARHACLMIKEERAKIREPIQFEAEKCNFCKLCHDLGCPAIEWDDETGPIVDELQCMGCEMCAALCHPKALYGLGVPE
ncbi:MAG: thiamine pyrophosphate-dependent enzyme, partial [Candidatus Krumholzibacteria bacterium]|nr:thiamine pyrophosphate-dependent enzyme [Candidatus Krumholzibacteria bacterium]